MSFRDSLSTFSSHTKHLPHPHMQLTLAMLKHLTFAREGKSDIPNLNHLEQ